MIARETLLAVILASAPAAVPSQQTGGQPVLPRAPYTWIYGAQEFGSTAAMEALGLNTLFLEMPAEVNAAVLAQAQVVIAEAGRSGLNVIVGLPTTLEGAYRVSLDNAPYLEALRSYVTAVIPALRDEPAVIGWATGDYLERELGLSDAAFRQYLATKYVSVQRLNEVWETDVRSLIGVTMADAVGLDDEVPFAVGMPSVDLADYHALAYRHTMAFWAELIRDAAPEDDLLFTGRVTLYRSLPLIPEAYDVIVVSTPPDLLEPDWATHNVQSIDIARRGGRRNVVPCLRLPDPLSHTEAFASLRLHEWMMIAAMHGAVGLSFEAPPEVMREPVVDQQLSSGLAWMSRQPAFRCRPRAVAAALYEPYADGFSALDVPVYGFISGLSSREPSDLYNAFKPTTRFGLLDCLAVEDVHSDQLSRYSVLFVPMALNLPDAVQQTLVEYVTSGGVVVADIGAGFVQTGSWQVLPPNLEALFGVSSFQEMKSLTGNLTIHQPHPAFPSLPSGASTTGDFQGGSHGRRTGSGAYAVSGWAGFTLLPQGTVPFARLAMSVTEDKHPTFAGLVARDTGVGTTVFATHRLWSSWLPGHQLFDEFHADVWQRRATIELIGAPFISPPVLPVESEGGAVFLYNPGRAVRAQLALYAAAHRLYSNAVCQFSARMVDESGLRSGGVLATVDAPEHSSMEIAPIPVEVRPYAGVVSSTVEEYGTARVQLLVAGDGSGPSGKLGDLTLVRGKRQNVRLTVKPGEYEIAPRSRHRLRATDEFGRSSDKTLTADDEGRLQTDLQVERARVTIEPVRP